MIFGRKPKPEPAASELIPLAIVTRRILDGTSRLRWATHRAPINPADSGWHFLAIDETDQTMADSNNFTLVALDDVIRIEPAGAMSVHLPVGADLGLDPRGATPVWFDAVTGTPI